MLLLPIFLLLFLSTPLIAVIVRGQRPVQLELVAALGVAVLVAVNAEDEPGFHGGQRRRQPRLACVAAATAEATVTDASPSSANGAVVAEGTHVQALT